MPALWALMLLLSMANAVTVLKDPEAWRFFAMAIAVIVAVGAVGSVVALILTAVRRIAERRL